MKDGMAISNTPGRYNITESIVPPRWKVSLLELCDVSLQDAGVYECVANNSLMVGPLTYANESRRSSQITVLGENASFSAS